MRLIQHEKPKLKLPEFVVDEPLSKHLEDDPLLKHMNKSFCCAMLSMAGGGKTSLLVALLQTPKKFRKVFHKIYVFMPSGSQDSMKSCPFDCLPDDQRFESVTPDNLMEVYNRMQEDSANKRKSLLVFDDVQSYFGDVEVMRILGHIVNNRRHLRCSVFLILQTFNQCPRKVRKAITHMFIWNIVPDEWDDINKESVMLPKKDWKQLLAYFMKRRREDPHTFMFIVSQGSRVFIDWDEIHFDAEEDCITTDVEAK